MADVQVTFGANIQQLVDGVAGIKSEIAGLAQAFGVAFSIEGLREFVSGMEDLGTNAVRTAAMLGVSTTEAQQLGFIAKATGGDADGMALAMERLQVNLQKAQSGTGPAAQALQALGLSAKSLIGLPIDQQMGRIADAVAKFADGGNKTAIVMDLLGRGGAQMIPMLDKGSAGWDALRKAAQDAGVVVSGETVDALDRAGTASVTLRASLTALGEAIVASFANSLIKTSNEMAQFVGDLSAIIQTGNFVQAVMIQLSGALETVASNFHSLGVIAADALTLHWTSIAADWRAGNAEIVQIQKDTDGQLAALAQESRTKLQAMLAEPLTSDKQQAPALAVPNTDAHKAAMDQYQAMIKVADEEFRQTQEHLGAEAKLHEITYSQETAALLAALDKRHAAETAATDGELSLYARGTAGYNAVLKTRSEEDAKYFADRQKIVDQATEREAQQWQKAADQIAGAFNSQLKGLLAGTTTWAKAMKNISADLILKMIEDQVKLSVEFLARKAMELSTTIATEAGMTSATTAGAALRAAAQVASGQASIFSLIANAVESITVSAGKTGAEVAAYVAPAVGPAAPAVGAGAAAEVLGLSAFDVGTDYVMRSGIAMIHQGETIVPAAQGSGPYTGKNDRAGAGAGGGNVSVNISAMDSRSVARFFNDNAGHMIRAINKGVRNGAHLGLRGARA
jgi:hypothetical protein